MIQSESFTRRSSGSFNIYRAMLIALALVPAACNQDKQQAGKTPPTAPQAPASAPQSATPPVQPTPATPPSAPAAKPLTDLESLVAPIALYPDPLLAELLVASTYPLEVVQAARWLDTKPDLATLNTKDWDASVMRLASVPQVIKMMSDHLDWTTQLGDAFLAKPAELMDAIQMLRKRATESGFLKDTPEQKVTAKTVTATQPAEEAATEVAGEGSGEATVKATPAVLKKEVITIEPAKSDTVYVPQYSPEAVYQAPLAPPPTTGTGYAYPATTAAYPAAAPAPSYYPTYYPAPATSTTSTTDSLLTFGAGALAGGLLTWGIMEWADDDDDWDDDYHVVHHYGDSVCHNGNCWSGGGEYYGGRGDVNVDRGDITRNRNVNISGNEITMNRGGVFSQSDLQPTQRAAGWQPNARHRRGQDYPEAVQKRLGRTEQPALAGQRLSAAQTLPATARGFAEAGGRPTAGTLPAERRPSSAEVRERLAQKPGTQERLGERWTRPEPRDIQARLGQGTRDNALEGLREPGQATRVESRRGAESRKLAPSPATRETRTREPAGGERLQRPRVERPRQPPAESRPKFAERRAEPSQRFAQRQALEGRERAQQTQMQRRAESARPNAFEGERNARAAQNFSQRGAASRQQMAAARPQRDFGGGGRPGGGGARGGGGGRRR